MNRFIRFPEVHSLVGLSRSTIWRLEGRGEFPPRRRVGKNVVGWIEQEVKDWINSRPLVNSPQSNSHVAWLRRK